MKRLQPPAVIKAGRWHVFLKRSGGERCDDAIMAIDFQSVVVFPLHVLGFI
jgi:hypothetical protein